MPSHKIDRISSEILRYVNQIILTEIEDENIKKVSLTECKVTSDLSYADFYFSHYSDLTNEEMTEVLNEAASFIRGKLSQLIELRHTPSLRFKYDETIDVGNNIERIINNIHNS